METIENIKILQDSTKKIERLSIVDAIDSLYLFGYDSNSTLLFFNKQQKTFSNKLDYLQQINKAYKDIDCKLYYANSVFELLPRSLFLYGDEENYLKNLFPHTNQYINFIDRCQEQQMVIVYKIKTLKDIQYRELFRGLHTYHIVSAIIKNTSVLSNVLYAYKLGSLVFYFMKDKNEWNLITCKNIHEGYSFVTSLKEAYNLYDKVNKMVLCGDVESNQDINPLLFNERIELLTEDLNTSLNFLNF